MGNTKQNKYLHRNKKSHKMKPCEYCRKPSRYGVCGSCQKEFDRTNTQGDYVGL
jgi:hypothetical protein